MSATGSIVAYRNPLEQWWWESGWAYWGVAAAVGFAALLVLLWVASNALEWVSDRQKKRRIAAIRARGDGV